MMRLRIVGVGCAALLAAGAVTVTAPARNAAKAATSCTSSSIGFMTALTGAGAPFGQEQRKFVKFELAQFNKANKTQFKLVEGDTKFDPSQASVVAQQLASNKSVLGVVGPGGSSEVIAIGKIMKKASLAMVSPSATRTDLTSGQYPTFFRDVPGDSVEAPTEANFIVDKLKAKKVAIIDDQSAYSVPLSDGVQQILTSKGVTVQRESVNLKETTDYSSLVSKIGSDVDLVYLVWLTVGPPNTFGQQMQEQGKKTPVFIPGLYGQFKLPQGGYTSSFAPDIRLLPSRAALVKAFDKAVGKSWGSYGPPTYGATQIVLGAMNAACADGKATRAEVVANIRKTKINDWILGGTFSFTKGGDPKGASYYIFSVDPNGKYTLLS
jgi:branched-chain amino acid transport system substrate-binding protein